MASWSKVFYSTYSYGFREILSLRLGNLCKIISYEVITSSVFSKNSSENCLDFLKVFSKRVRFSYFRKISQNLLEIFLEKFHKVISPNYRRFFQKFPNCFLITFPSYFEISI